MVEQIPTMVVSQPESGIDHALKQFQQFLIKNPVACQTIFSALVKEGRVYSSAEEGRAKLEQLRRSELLNRASRAWEASSLWMLDGDDDAVLPSGYVDAVFMAGLSDNLEEILKGLFPKEL